MDPVEITLIMEQERQKCLNIIKKYYHKHGNESVEKLYTYLESQLEKVEETSIINDINYDMEILRGFMKQN
jgi:hypothetical protein